MQQEPQKYYWFVCYSGPFSFDGMGSANMTTKDTCLVLSEPYPRKKRIQEVLATLNKHAKSSSLIVIHYLEKWPKEQYDVWIS
jgi:hypothetical protein